MLGYAFAKCKVLLMLNLFLIAFFSYIRMPLPPDGARVKPTYVATTIITLMENNESCSLLILPSFFGCFVCAPVTRRVMSPARFLGMGIVVNIF